MQMTVEIFTVCGRKLTWSTLQQILKIQQALWFVLLCIKTVRKLCFDWFLCYMYAVCVQFGIHKVYIVHSRGRI